MKNQLLTPNEWSRPEKEIHEVRFIVIHWLMNAGQKAFGARKWFEDRKKGKNGYGSAHVIIDEQETILCVPYREVAYHTGTLSPTPFAIDICDGGDPNFYSIGIELAHADWTGKPGPRTWKETVKVCNVLCSMYDIPASRIVTHFDVVGMQDKWNGMPCHRWFNEQPGEMAKLRMEVEIA